MEGFFTFITTHWNTQTTATLKRWGKINAKLASYNNRIIFLLECKRHNIFPNHISNGIKGIHSLISTENRKFHSTILNFNYHLKIKILKLEISITNHEIRNLHNELKTIKQEMKTILPAHIYNSYNNRQKIFYNKKFNKIKQINLNKIKRLKENLNQSLLKTNKKWIKNLSNVNIPTEIELILSLGKKFNLVPLPNEVPLPHLIGDIENILEESPRESQNAIRAKITNIITNFYTHKHDTHNNKHLTLRKLFNQAKSFLKNHPDLIVTNSDKGNITVILHKDTYIQLAEELLSDNKYYKKLDRNPNLTLQNKINTFLKKLHNKHYIDKDTLKSLTTYSSTISKFYGLPKIHKPTLKLRPIVSSINSAASSLCKYTSDILKSWFQPKYNVKDVFEFVDKTRNFTIPQNYRLVSLDVVNLFTNIPKDAIMQVIRNNWADISSFTAMSESCFIEMLELIFDSGIFIFNGSYYKQHFGVAMGSKVSMILSAIALEALFDKVIPELDFELPFLFVYVDDTVTAVPADKQDYVLQKFNDFSPFIQFTIETEDNTSSIPFLDTKLTRNGENKIEIDWNRKEFCSNRFIHFESCHTFQTKINAILGMKKRILNISDEKFKIKNLKLLRTIFQENGYPGKLLNKILFSTHTGQLHQPVTEDVKKYKTIPYIPGLSETIKRTFNKHQMTEITYNYIPTVSKIYTPLKDKTPIMDMRNCVYEIFCTCGRSYVGQSSLKLSQRLSLHRSDEKNPNKTCALAVHARSTKHVVNYDKINILTTESSTKHRLISEMFYITKNRHNTINCKNDTANLSASYSYLIDIYKK